jgi:hypothetical protein
MSECLDATQLLMCLGGIQQLCGPKLIHLPHRVANCGPFTYYLLFVHFTKRGLSTDHLPTSFCPRSYQIPH